MKTRYFAYIFLILNLTFYNAHAQKKDNPKNIPTQQINSETISDKEDSLKLSASQKDSILIEELTLQLQEMRMNEILLRSEFEEASKKTIKDDSIRKAVQRHQIDSLRIRTPGTPIIIEGDTLFKLYTRRGGVTPKARAESAENMITQFGRSITLQRDSIYLFTGDYTTDIMVGEKVIISITEQDGLWQNKSRDQLAQEYLPVISKKIDDLQAEYGLAIRIKRLGLFTLVILVQLALIVFTNKMFRKLRRRIVRFSHEKLKSVKIKEYEFLNTHKQARILLLLSQIAKLLLIAIQLIISIPLLFSIFPETENLAMLLLSYIWDPIKGIILAIAAYFPNIIKIVVIYFCFKYIVRGVRYLTNEIATEKLSISGFFPDWAYPTYYIIRFLLYSFMMIMIWPLLPNSESPIFSGVSVFIGLIISLGSTTVIGNLMAGMIITYMRPFRKGDQIKINDIVGSVIEKSPFVTRIKTLKNEIVTIPNSFVMSSHTINYTMSAEQYGIIIHTDITVDYNVDSKLVHELLLSAAKDTSTILKYPKPFVLNTQFSDFYFCYQINGYTKEDKSIPRVYSELHQHIRDKFGAAGIELLSPHYYSQLDKEHFHQEDKL